MATNANDHAYPVSATVANRIIEGYGFPEEYLGMTKREYYAGLAMQIYLAIHPGQSPHLMAKEAIAAADALIYELSDKA